MHLQRRFKIKETREINIRTGLPFVTELPNEESGYDYGLTRASCCHQGVLFIDHSRNVTHFSPLSLFSWPHPQRQLPPSPLLSMYSSDVGCQVGWSTAIKAGRNTNNQLQSLTGTEQTSPAANLSFPRSREPTVHSFR